MTDDTIQNIVKDTLEEDSSPSVDEHRVAQPQDPPAKKPRSPAQIAAMEKAWKTRQKNLQAFSEKNSEEKAAIEKLFRIQEAKRILAEEKAEKARVRAERKAAREEAQQARPPKPKATKSKPRKAPVRPPEPSESDYESTEIGYENYPAPAEDRYLGLGF